MQDDFACRRRLGAGRARFRTGSSPRPWRSSPSAAEAGAPRPHRAVGITTDLAVEAAMAANKYCAAMPKNYAHHDSGDGLRRGADRPDRL